MIGTQEEAAEAYDIAAIKFRGVNAVTNFDISRYDVERIVASNNLLAGELARRNRETEICHDAFNRNRLAVSSLGDIFPHGRNSRDEPTRETEQQQFRVGYDMARAPSDVPLDSNVMGGNLGCTTVEDLGKAGMHLSNPSSLVTSLGSSREGSPERSLVPTSLGVVHPGTDLSRPSYASAALKDASPWIPTSEIRPGVAVPHMPVFASWTDL